MSPPVAAVGHDVGGGGGGAGGLPQLGAVHAVGLEVGADGGARFVVADKADGAEGESAVHASEVLEQIVGPAAVAAGLAQHVGQTVLLGPGVDDLDLVEDEVAAREDTLTFLVSSHWRSDTSLARAGWSSSISGKRLIWDRFIDCLS